MKIAYVTEEGAYIRKKENKLVVTRKEDIVLEIPIENLNGLVITDYVQVSSQATAMLLRKGIFLTWISSKGEFIGRLESPYFADVDKQYDQISLVKDCDFCNKLSRQIILAKMKNSVTILRRFLRNKTELKINWGIFARLEIAILKTNSLKHLMGYEGFFAKQYFKIIGENITDEFKFIGRSKRPPRDKFNSIISFGYTLLFYEIQTLIINKGLHPYFSYMHKFNSRYMALAADLMEEWRAVLIDAIALAGVAREIFTEFDFDKIPGSGAIYLNRTGKKKFVELYERKMLSVNKYFGSSYSYRHTLGWQVDKLVNAILAKDPDKYTPLIIR